MRIKLSIFILLQVLFGQIILAQSSTTSSSSLDRLKDLSEKQKIIFEERKAIIKELRSSFKASLTQAQKAILKNDSMPKKMRRKAFVKSLTEEQKKIYSALRKSVDRTRGEFHKSKDNHYKNSKGHRHSAKHRD